MECFVPTGKKNKDNVVLALEGSEFFQYLKDLTEAIVADCTCPVEDWSKSEDFTKRQLLMTEQIKWFNSWELTASRKYRANALYALVGGIISSAGYGWIDRETAEAAAKALDMFQKCREIYYSDYGAGKDINRFCISIKEITRKFNDQNDALMDHFDRSKKATG